MTGVFEGAPRGAKQFTEMLMAVVGRLGHSGVEATDEHCADVAQCSLSYWRFVLRPWLERSGFIDVFPSDTGAFYRPSYVAMHLAMLANEGDRVVVATLAEELRRRGESLSDDDGCDA
jgi:hypothetical protein